MARALRISPLVVGLTVVAFATSAPELAVSAQAALDGNISRLEGAFLLLGLFGYIGASVWLTMRGRVAGGGQPTRDAPQHLRSIVLVAAGVAALVMGANLLVEGASSLARAAGISELVIGLTIVAIGTSLPELVTSVMGAVRGEREIAAGNVIGSNIFNVLGVLGSTALLAPAGVPVAARALGAEIPIMLGATVLAILAMLNGRVVRRWEGLLLLLAYVGYLVWLLW